MLDLAVGAGVGVLGLFATRWLAPTPSPSFQCHCSCASSGLLGDTAGLIGGLVLLGLAEIASILVIEVRKLRAIIAAASLGPTAAERPAIAAPPRLSAIELLGPPALGARRAPAGPPVKRGFGIVEGGQA